MTNPYILSREDLNTDTSLDAGFRNALSRVIHGGSTQGMKARDLAKRFEVLSKNIEEVGRKKRSLDERINKVEIDMNSATSEMRAHTFTGEKSRFNNMFINNYNNLLKRFDAFKMEKNKLKIKNQIPQWVNTSSPTIHGEREQPAEQRPDRRQRTGKYEQTDKKDDIYICVYI